MNEANLITKGEIIITRTYRAFLLWIIGLYLILNMGFMQIRIPPVVGGGIPIGEIVLLISLLTVNHVRQLRDLSKTVYLVPFIIWWTLSLSQATLGVSEYGMWALRDASHVIESLFLIVGFAFAVRIQEIDRFFKWIPKILLIATIYGFTYPFRDTLSSISPILVSGAGYDVPLFFNFNTTFPLLLVASAYLLLYEDGKRNRGWLYYPVSILVLGYTVFISQSRTVYLQIAALLSLFFIYRRKLFGKWVIAILLLAIILLAISAFDIQIIGRLGQSVSYDFLIKHFLTIGGVENQGVEGAAAGVDLRLSWWSMLYDQWASNIQTVFFGLGYGLPLTDFYNLEGAIVREPHNSYISVWARLGIIGILAFTWMHILLIKTWLSAYRKCVRLNWQEGIKWLLLMMIFFVLVWTNAIGEDAFEKPFFAIPYYFFWGVTLRFALYLKSQSAEMPASDILGRDGALGYKPIVSYGQPYYRGLPALSGGKGAENTASS